MAPIPPYGDPPANELELDPQAGRRREFAIAETTVGNATVDCISVLAISGTLDRSTAPKLTQAIDHAVVMQSPRALIIDVTDVDFLSTAGMVALVSADDKLKTIAPLAVVADGSATSRVLKMIRLDSILKIYSSLDVALNELGIHPTTTRPQLRGL
jgi:anti-sigma B factor antagonist